MSSRLFLSAFIASACLFAAGSNALSQTAEPSSPSLAETPRISVAGTGTAEIAPDMAIVELTVLREGKTAREALDANNTAMAEVLAAMKEDGLAERDLQTSNFQIEPVYRYSDRQSDTPQEPTITGYRVSNSLTVRLRELDNLGSLLDKAVSLGVNQGGQIRLTNDDPSSTQSEARTAAVKDAMEKGETLAAAAGISLGRILEISESNSFRPPLPVMEAQAMARDASASVPVAKGENSYRVDVQVVFEIDQQ